MLRVEPHGPLTRLRLSRTFCGRPLYEVSAYLVDGVLVDSGPPATAGELAGWLRRRPPGEVEAVVNTHHHEDHVGGDARLSREFGLPVLAPAATVERLARRRPIPFYRRLIWGAPAPCPGAQPLGDSFSVAGRRWRVVPTPGHAFDHVALFHEERRWLFSGDLYVHERVRYLRRIEDPWAHLDSLARVAALDPELLVCSHAGPIADARGALERKIAWWQGLAGEARRLLDRGLSERRVSRRLLGREGLFTYLSFGDFSKRNLVRALAAGPPRGLRPPGRARTIPAPGPTRSSHR